MEESRMKKWHVLGGATALGLGVYGVYDEYFVVVEFIKGSLQPLLVLAGLAALLAGVFAARLRTGHVVAGLLLLGVGVYGFFDEYYATLDFFKGVVPPLLLIIGMVSVVSGVKQLQ